MIFDSWGLFSFSPEDITYVISEYLKKSDAMTLASATIMLSLAKALVRRGSRSGEEQINIADQVLILLFGLTSFLPIVRGIYPEGTFGPEYLEHQAMIPFREYITLNPEILYGCFQFLAQTTDKYSNTWQSDWLERWMVTILVSLGTPESGMSFTGAVEFLVPHYLLFQIDPGNYDAQGSPESRQSLSARHARLIQETLTEMTRTRRGQVLSTFDYYREAILAQILKVIAFWCC